MKDRKLLSLVAAMISLVSVGVSRAGASGASSCPGVSPEPLSFEAPRYIDTTRAGGEPVSVVAQDGSIIVSAHAGTTHLYKNPQAAPGAGDFVVGYTNETLNWRSTDAGRSWSYIGTAGLPAGPHTIGSTGFSDPDLTIDAGGRIYNVEINLPQVAAFSSNDDGQSFMTSNPIAGNGDRPWITGRAADEAFLNANAFLGEFLWHTTDGGITWSLVNQDIPVDGKMAVDPRNGNLIGAYGDSLSISADDGQSWRRTDDAPLGRNTAFFGDVAIDSAGYVYLSAAGGYRGPFDALPDGQVTFAYYDQAADAWGEKVEIPTPPGDALWPWTIAGDDGRAAVVWLQSLAGDPTTFYVFAAVTSNAHGTTVTCSDGSTQFIPPQFSVANASGPGHPVHRGMICQQGTTCNAVTGDAGDRRLGDFITVNFDASGTVFIASGDSTLPNPIGGPKPVSNPLFIRQAGGAHLLQTPRPVRPTRCLFGLPVCEFRFGRTRASPGEPSRKTEGGYSCARSCCSSRCSQRSRRSW